MPPEVIDFAEHVVLQWVEATRANAGELDRYFDADTLGALPEIATDAENAATATVNAIDENTWSVTVGLDIGDAAAELGDPGMTTRRYFQLPVRVTANSNLVALMLPAPVHGPAAGEPNQAVREGADVDAEQETAVEAFLAALLAGVGHVEPLVSPGVAIAAITPTPYVSVDLLELRAPRSDRSSDEMQVVATAAVTDPHGRTRTVQYALTLRQRADRWEVSAIALAPDVAHTED